MTKYNLIWEALESVEFGSIQVTLPDQSSLNFDGKIPGPKANIHIKKWRAIDTAISGGDVGFGEGYMADLWDSDNLADLLTFLTLNSEVLEDFFHAKKFQSFLLFLKTFFNKNTKRGSKKNIKKHYDLGNDFYELWLDESMTYSSAIFDAKNFSLQDAQLRKYQNILDKLSGKKILEIGCGWGGFAENAIKQDFKVTGLTISQRQKEYAKKRLESFKKENLVELKLQDYRDEKGQYDNIVSIEMFEAVGKEYWDQYFEVAKNCLKDKGKAVLQIITIDEEVFKDYKNRVDFIQKHIFPGGVLPSKSAVRDLAKNHGFEVTSEYEFGIDYAKTLAIWLENFDKKYLEVKKLGFDDEFIRKWRFYLSYCIAGFMSKRTDVVQFELTKK